MSEADASVQAVPSQGTLSEMSPVRLAYLVARTGWTGRVDLALAQGEGQVHFAKGRVQAVSHPALPLGPWLEADGLLTDQSRARAELEAEAYGGLAAALFALGLADPGEAFAALTRHSAESWERVLSTEEGRFTAQAGAPGPANPLPLEGDPLAWLLRTVLRWPAEVVRRRLGSRRHAPAMKSNAAGVDIGRLGLGPREARLYPLFDGVHGPEVLAADLPEAEGDRLLRLAWLLGECDFLSFGEPRSLDEPDAPRAAPPPARDWEEELQQARKVVARLSRADWFTVLGLKRQCTAAEVKQAYTEAVRRWHPDRVAGGPAALLAAHRDLFALATQAHRVLGEDGSRRDYLNELAAQELQAARAPSPAEREALEAARELVASERWDEADSALEALLDRQPDLAQGWAWRAWVAVCRSPDPNRAKRQALEWVTRALRLDARCGDAYLVAGRIARLFGDETHAKKYLARARDLGATGA